MTENVKSQLFEWRVEIAKLCHFYDTGMVLDETTLENQCMIRYATDPKFNQRVRVMMMHAQSRAFRLVAMTTPAEQAAITAQSQQNFQEPFWIKHEHPHTKSNG